MRPRLFGFIALPLLVAGCGQAAQGAVIPKAFWGEIDPLVRTTGFPRRPGEAACRIPAGGVHLAGIGLIAGRCATGLRRPTAADLRLVAAGAREEAAWTVVLSQACSSTCSATFTYVISRRGAVLGEGIAGHPPQLWK